MLICALVSLYALWFMSVTLVLWTGRIQNISMVMGPIIEMARVPSDVFRGVAKPLMMYVLPVAAIATLPAQGDAGYPGAGHAAVSGGAGGGPALALALVLAVLAAALHQRE